MSLQGLSLPLAMRLQPSNWRIKYTFKIAHLLNFILLKFHSVRAKSTLSINCFFFNFDEGLRVDRFDHERIFFNVIRKPTQLLRPESYEVEKTSPRSTKIQLFNPILT